MAKYLKVVRALTIEFHSWNINKIPRAENSEADKLLKFASIAMIEPHRKRETKIVIIYLPNQSTEK